MAVAVGSAGVGVQCGLGGGVGDVGGDVVEDAGAELAQQDGVELPGPVDEHTDGLVGGLGAGRRAARWSTVSAMTRACSRLTRRSASACRIAGGRVDARREVDQPAGSGNGQAQSLAQPDRGAGRALRARGAPTVHLAHQRQLDGGETLLQAVRGIERRDQLILGESPGGVVNAGSDRVVCLRQLLDHDHTLEQVYDNFQWP